MANRQQPEPPKSELEEIQIQTNRVQNEVSTLFTSLPSHFLQKEPLRRQKIENKKKR
jgi:hypothetical protein